MVKTVAIIGANGVPASYGGWDQLLEAFSKVSDDNVRFVIFCTYKTNQNHRKKYNNATIEVVNLDANGWQSIPYDIISLYRAYRMTDVTVMLGTSGCIALPLFRLLGQKIILNIDGAEWRRGKWGYFVKTFLKISEYLGVKNAAVVISDNVIISHYVENTYSITPETISYGADHISHDEARDDYRALQLDEGSYFFKVCRIVPENNLDMILNAFSKTDSHFILVGNFENSDYGISLRKKFVSYRNIHLLDPIYDQHTLNAYRANAGVYIHGHSVGGTNPSLIEAMYLGLNIFSFDVKYNRETTNGLASFFKNEEELLNLISQFQEGSIVDYGKKAKKFAHSSYTWKRIMDQYIRVINKIGEK